MKKLLTLLLFISSFTYSHAQKKLTITDGLRINNVTIDSISTDSALGGLNNVLPTQKAIRDYVLNRFFQQKVYTVAQLRAMTSTTGNIYSTIDGSWFDEGLNDGGAVDDGGVYIITANGHGLRRKNTDGKIHLSWFGTGNNANLTKALAYENTIVIDEPLSISSNFTIPQGKIIEISKGGMVTTTGANKLVIAGKLTAGAYQIFDVTSNVKLRPTSVVEIYPEWWGAVALSNPRLGTVGAGATDATAAIKKAVAATEGEIYGDKAFGTTIRFNGWFGISDQILIKGATNIIGKSPEFEGSGLRWLGTGDSSKSMLLFQEAEFSSVKDMGFRGRGSSNAATMLKAAIELRFLYTGGMQTQRRIVLNNLIIGNPIGYFFTDNAGTGGGYDFKRGIYCSGDAGNNDFHLIDGIFMADTDIGIDNASDQAVEWRINNFQKNYGGVMYRSQLGGSVIGDRWYAEATDGVFDIGGTISQEIRIGMTNLSTEYLASNFFIKSEAKVRLEISGESYFSVNPNLSDSTDGFALITGHGGAGVDGNYKFSSVRFAFNPGYEGKTLYPGYTNPTPRMYIDQTYSTATSKIVSFENCAGFKDYLYFKFPVSFDANNSNYTFLSIKGENNINFGVNSNFYQHDKELIVNVKNPNITQGTTARWLKIESLFNGETDIPNNTINLGEKGKTITVGMSVKGFKSTTIASNMQAINAILPARSIIKSVTVKTEDANTLPYFFTYLTVGTNKNDRQFGTVAMPNAGYVNTSPATMYFTDTAEPLIIKGWRDRSDVNAFTLSGTALSASFASSFDPASVGGIVRFSSGREVIITGYTDDSHVTVSNPNSYAISGEHAIVQEALAATKNLTINIAYEEVQKSVSELDINYAPSLPIVTMVSKTPVLNEKKYVIGAVDTTGFAGGGGSYSLPVASSVSLGGVRVGTGLAIDGAGIVTNTGVLSETNLMHKSGDEVVDGAKTLAQNFTVSTLNSISKVILKNAQGKGTDFGMSADDFGSYGAIGNTTGYLHNVYAGGLSFLADHTSGTIRFAAGGSTTKLTVGGSLVTSAVPVVVPNAVASDQAVNLGQVTTDFVKKTDSTTIYTGTYIKGTGQSGSPLDVDISKVQNAGTVSFTGDGATTSFTFISSVPGLSTDSKIFITARTAIGAAIDHADVSTESFTVYFLTAPTSGAKTLNYLIVP